MDNYNPLRNREEFDSWQNLTQPMNAVDSSDSEQNQILDNSVSKQKKKHRVLSPILTFQLAICLIFLTFIYLVQVFVPSLYTSVMGFYTEQINTSMYFSGDFSEIYYAKMFESTADEV